MRPKVDDRRLVGRASELNAVDLALDALGRGAPVPLLIGGEPGIGKTRLLAELDARAVARGCVVLHGSASELESDLPFWIFVDALDEYVAGLDPRVLAGLTDETLGEIAHMLPSASKVGGGGSRLLQDERYRAHRAMRELLSRLASPRPLVLVLDDVHWADAASVDLVIALVRGAPARPVLIVLAARPRQLPDRLRAALDRAERNGGLDRIEVAGLSREAARELLGDGVGRGAAERLYAESGGNPFYLEQLARADGTRVDGGPSVPDAAGVPAAVLASLAEEVGLLPAQTQRLLRGAAVTGDPFDADVAVAAAGVEEPAAMDAFDELLAAGLLRSTEVPRRFRFRHPLVRRAVYESTPGGWLLGAHGRAATSLSERGAPAAARAHHVEYAARPGDLDAVAVLAAAGMAGLLRAPASAARWLSAALRILPGDAPTEQRVGLLLTRARALAAQGRLAESHADLVECIAVAPADAVGLRVQLVTACAGVERLLGRHAEAHARLLACLGELPEPTAADAISLMLELAVDALFRSDTDALLAWARRAQAGARDLGDRPLIAASAALVTLGHAVAGRIPEAERAYAEASALVAAMPDAELGARSDALAYLCSAGTFLDRYDEACRHGERALALGRAAGHLHPTLIPAIGAAHLLRGRLAEAADVLDAGLEAARLAGVTQSTAWMLRNRALLAVATGDARDAMTMADEALELIERLDESVLSAWAALAVARAAVAAGRSERAIEVLASSDRLNAVPGAWRLISYEALALAYLDLGRRDDAVGIAARADAHAAALGLPMATLWARRIAAAVALDAGDPVTAVRDALDAIAAGERAGAEIEVALTRPLAARALAEAGDRDSAATQLELACAAFDARGAFPHRSATEQQLRQLGRTVHRRTRPGAADSGVASLTGRELEVARLVVDRHTNQQIADELFLSLKTVESHMRNIFRKLDVSSRAELARTVESAQRRP
ncbi:helix-turn-helix transcriptional regulator [Solirubrobacter soli]|uniref:helix-turn-helix transcriptional regulator n=1 Tax=Solirubrobacter soli TaxID=363832 RepID=UPI0004127272|nr:AAA family ATPase [Solirubrobacter soli]